MRFINFLLLFCSGLAIIYYRERLQRFTGPFESAEKYLGSGGTYRFFALLGVAICMGSFLYLTGTLDSMISGTVGRFFLTPN